MRDVDIRQALHAQLAVRHAMESDTLILDELGLCQGTSRVDVAVINGSITGYEIKSERDTLARLAGQQAIYNRVLDRVVVVAEGHHVEVVNKLIPGWWGLMEAAATDRGVDLVEHRPGEENPSADAEAIAQLLWKDEVLDALQKLGADKGLRSKPCRVLWRALASNMDLADLKALVRETLKSRSAWRSGGAPS